MNQLTKTKTIMCLKNVFSRSARFTCDDEPGDQFRHHTLWLDKAVFEEMGSPETITLTIEPGDALNV